MASQDTQQGPAHLLTQCLFCQEWCTVHIDGHLCVNSFSWPMSFDTYSLLWKVGDLELLYTSGVEGKMSMIKPAQTLNIKRVASAWSFPSKSLKRHCPSSESLL